MLVDPLGRGVELWWVIKWPRNPPASASPAPVSSRTACFALAAGSHRVSGIREFLALYSNIAPTRPIVATATRSL